MRLLPLVAAFLCFTSAALFAAKEAPDGALSALKLLPRGESKKIARIEARDGTPAPERWHIVVHDPKDENGVHEYVVAGGEIVASRALSQFAESVRAEDVVSASVVKIDYRQLAELAQQYALANNMAVAALNYALKKEGAAATPLWTVSCLDETGKEIGRLVVSAGRGNVISHDGFTAEPGAGALEKPDTQANSEVDRRTNGRRPANRPRGTPAPEKKDAFSGLRRFFTGERR